MSSTLARRGTPGTPSRGVGVQRDSDRAQKTHSWTAGRVLDVVWDAPEVAFDAGDTHGHDHHAGEAEGHFLRELLAVHAGLEAVPKVDVKQLPTVTVQHQVGGVPVSQAQQVPHLCESPARALTLGGVKTRACVEGRAQFELPLVRKRCLLISNWLRTCGARTPLCES